MKRLFLGVLLTLSLFNSTIEASPAAAAKAFGRAAKVALESGAVGLLIFPVTYYSMYELIVERKKVDVEELEKLLASFLEASRCDSFCCNLKRSFGFVNERAGWEKFGLDRIRGKIELVKECKGILSQLGEDPDKVRIVEDFEIYNGGAMRVLGSKFIRLNTDWFLNNDLPNTNRVVLGHECVHLDQYVFESFAFAVPATCATMLVNKSINNPTSSKLRFLGRVLFRNPMGVVLCILIYCPINWYYEWRADVQSADVLGCAESGVELMNSHVERALHHRALLSRDFDLDPSDSGFFSQIAITFNTRITKKGNDLGDILHPPLTWRLKQMQKLAKKQAEDKVKIEQEKVSEVED